MGKRKRVRFGAPDRSLTGSAGVVVLAELVELLGVVGLLDGAVGAVKQRDRGVSGGQLLVGLAQCQLLDGVFFAALDRQRADTAAQLLSAVPGVPARTANSLARRFGPAQRAGIEVGLAAVLARAVPLLPVRRRGALLAEAPTIDVDSTTSRSTAPASRGGLHLLRAARGSAASGDLGAGRGDAGRGAAGR